MSTRHSLFVVTFILLTSSRLCAQEPAQVDSIYYDEDSVKVYVMGTVTVTDRRESVGEPVALDHLSLSTLNRSDPTDVATILHEAPAARVQVNSRGEANVYLRSSGERQVSIFLDGALLNIPWDNRVDLSLIPTNVLGGMTVAKGNASVLYGANTLGGAVNLFTRELPSDGSMTDVRFGAGTNGFLQASGMHLGRSGDFNYIAAASFDEIDDRALPSAADLPFNQDPDSNRTNTDKRAISFYARGEYHLSDDDAVGLSLINVRGEKGVAPEGHLDPTTENVRYWRYPEWNLTSAIFTYRLAQDDEVGFGFRGAIWGTRFAQRIDQYSSVAYDEVSDVENDVDNLFGLRAILSLATPRSLSGSNTTISLGTTQFYAEHSQIDAGLNDSGSLTDGPEAIYRGYTFSIGPEVSTNNGPHGTLTHGDSRINYSLGLSYDGFITLASADKPRSETFTSLGFVAAASMMFDEPNKIMRSGFLDQPDFTVRNGSINASLARKSRFPTLRELYGEALRRFIPNPDLAPEKGWNGQIGYEWKGERTKLSVELFGQLVDGTIDQRTFDTLGGTKRQRINLEGSRTFGVELQGSTRIAERLSIGGHLTVMSARAIVPAADGSDSLTYLSEKPELLSTIDIGIDGPGRSRLDVESLVTGTSYSRIDEESFLTLSPSLRLNARLSYRFYPSGMFDVIELFVRGDNLTDAVQFYQAGLPEVGRELRGGVRVSF